MEREIIKGPNFEAELTEIIRSDISDDELREVLLDYHENDIAGAMENLTKPERKRLYRILDVEVLSEVFSYIDNANKYLRELKMKTAAGILSRMDSDEVVDILEELDEHRRRQYLALIDKEASEDVRMIMAFDDRVIGSEMTTNFIVIRNDLTIREAMKELVVQAGSNDNIGTIYVVDENERYCGAIDLKDLIMARTSDTLEYIIMPSYPYVNANEDTGECIEKIRDYEEDSIPVLSEDMEILGIITAQDIAEMIDEELGDDYAKLAGLTSEEDLNETTKESMKKRLPWLLILLFLGMAVSSVVGVFETVVAVIPIVMCFQSLILDMAGNVGTQSLAVTIRVLMDENLTAGQKLKLVLKEMKVGFTNGLFLGLLAFVFVGAYVLMFKNVGGSNAFMISGCVGIALMIAMIISSLVGTLIPMFFHRLNVDPAVASGPLITTVNDLVAVVTYYGLAWLLLIKITGMA